MTEKDDAEEEHASWLENYVGEVNTQNAPSQAGQGKSIVEEQEVSTLPWIPRLRCAYPSMCVLPSPVYIPYCICFHEQKARSGMSLHQEVFNFGFNSSNNAPFMTHWRPEMPSTLISHARITAGRKNSTQETSELFDEISWDVSERFPQEVMDLPASELGGFASNHPAVFDPVWNWASVADGGVGSWGVCFGVAGVGGGGEGRSCGGYGGGVGGGGGSGVRGGGGGVGGGGGEGESGCEGGRSGGKGDGIEGGGGGGGDGRTGSGGGDGGGGDGGGGGGGADDDGGGGDSGVAGAHGDDEEDDDDDDDDEDDDGEGDGDDDDEDDEDDNEDDDKDDDKDNLDDNRCILLRETSLGATSLKQSSDCTASLSSGQLDTGGSLSTAGSNFPVPCTSAQLNAAAAWIGTPPDTGQFSDADFRRWKSCTLCTLREWQVVYIPCGHLSCYPCREQLINMRCIFCGKHVEEIVVVRLAHE